MSVPFSGWKHLWQQISILFCLVHRYLTFCNAIPDIKTGQHLLITYLHQHDHCWVSHLWRETLNWLPPEFRLLSLHPTGGDVTTNTSEHRTLSVSLQTHSSIWHSLHLQSIPNKTLLPNSSNALTLPICIVMIANVCHQMAIMNGKNCVQNTLKKLKVISK